MKYRICWWEDNGYHDSYFHGVYFDDATGTLHKTELGATAYAGGIGFTDEYLMPTPEIVERARVLLSGLIFTAIRAAEHRDICEPGPHNIKVGMRLRLLADHSFYAKTGKEFAKNENGKRIKVVIPAGCVVCARKDGADFFGKEYQNGYNHPHRFNTTVSVSRKVGLGIQFVRVPLEKLRQDAEPMSDMELNQRAVALSYNYQFGAAFGMRAWETENWAAKIGVKAPVSESN